MNLNRPELALAALAGALRPGVVGGTRLSVADAQAGCDWIEIDQDRSRTR